MLLKKLIFKVISNQHKDPASFTTLYETISLKLKVCKIYLIYISYM